MLWDILWKEIEEMNRTDGKRKKCKRLKEKKVLRKKKESHEKKISRVERIRQKVIRKKHEHGVKRKKRMWSEKDKWAGPKEKK